MKFIFAFKNNFSYICTYKNTLIAQQHRATDF